MTRPGLAGALLVHLWAGIVGLGLVPATARAGSGSEFWPEASAFIRLNDVARLYLDASIARSKESDVRTLDASAYVDLSLKPILRPELWTQDWQRSRYLWARLGYTRVFKIDDGSSEVAENRGVLALYGKATLPAEVWLEARARVDLRWIGDTYSTRYRFRLEASREFEWVEHTVVPYANAEAFYDTRYDGWSRALVQAGTEIAISKGFRWEVYLARQIDRLPGSSAVNALGLVAKWYR